MTQKKIAACIFLKNGRAVTDFTGKTLLTETSPVILAEEYDHAGADELVIFDLSEGDEEHENALNMIRAIQRRVDIPIMGCGNVNRVEDVKKIALCRMPESGPEFLQGEQYRPYRGSLQALWQE